MATIAYVDHSYHKKTISTKFLPDILIQHGHKVYFFWDESWQGGSPVAWSDIEKYEAIIMFQSICPIYGKYYAQLHPNVTYIPMLDQFGVWCGPLFNLTQFWEPFQGCKVLNFSNAVHCMTNAFGIKSKFVRYFKPPRLESTTPKDGLRGFAWLRREEQISWELIKKLIGPAEFKSIHLHVAKDPGTPQITLPDTDDILKHNITLSSWFEDKQEFENVLDQCNVFFSPRMEEGIGQSFLEALSRGQCVVAPNQGTMNEYILHGVNGILFNSEHPEPVDFSNVNLLAVAGLQSAISGYMHWQRQEEDIVKYILSPNKNLYVGKYDHFNIGNFQSCSNKIWSVKEHIKKFPGSRMIFKYVKDFVK